MMKIIALSICLVTIAMPGYASQAKSKKEIELVACVSIKRTSNPKTMLTFGYQRGSRGYRIEELFTHAQGVATRYHQKEPLFKSAAGKHKPVCNLVQLAKIPQPILILLQKAMSMAQHFSQEHKDAWTTWRYYSDGSVKFVKTTLLKDLEPYDPKKQAQKFSTESRADADEDSYGYDSDASQEY